VKKQQQQIKKARPRGRPWPKGHSGNPAGRPRGSLNKVTLAVQEGIRRAEEKLARPLLLNLNLPYGAWDGFYEQHGQIFRKDNLQLRKPDAVVLPQLEMLDIRKRRQEIKWKKKQYYIQNGWCYDRGTLLAVKI
jgi:hypothetical protein